MKSMLITGASRGIGAATALLAAERGFAVAVNYNKNKTAADQIIQKIRNQGGWAVAIQANVSREDEVQNLFRSIDTEFGYLDVLVNNASILEPQTEAAYISSDRWQRIFNNNTLSVFLCCKEAIRRMAYRNGGSGGSIVNVSSIAAKTGAPFEYVDYAASKGAVDSLTVGLAKEIAEEGIRVNAVRPALINTDIHASGGEANRIERLKNNIPMKRGGLASEVAEAIMWLATDLSSYTTGSFINVSGGLSGE